MTLSEVKSWFLAFKNNYDPDLSGTGSDKEFCILANGFWQAEGYIGGIFRSDINFYPLCTATQLLCEESVKFFLRLDKAISLREMGTFSITLNSMGKFVIQYRLSGWDTFFSVFVPYFYMLYGAKYQAIFKLKKIHELKRGRLQNSDNMSKVLLISYAYSLTAYSSRYKLSLKDKLLSLKLDPALLNELPTSTIPFGSGQHATSVGGLARPENNINPSFLFILGFFLGDGTLHLKLEWREKNSVIAIVPLFNILQSNVESNKQIMELMTNVLNNMGIKASLVKGKNTLTLTVKGIKNVFNSLLPLLKEYSHFLYWKNDSLNLLLWVQQLVKIGGHHTYYGLNALIDKVYSSTNARFTQKAVWVSRLNDWLKTASSRRERGESYISPIYTPNKEIRGWQVRFPTTLKLPKSNKAFISSTYGGQDKAFASAVQYRDKTLSDWISKAL